MRARVVVVAGLVVAGLAVGTYLVVRTDDVPAAVPPPIMPTATSTSEVTIPVGFLMADARSARPAADQEVRWERAEGSDLPVLVSPCGEPLSSDTDRVAGRQVALVEPQQLWKLERLVVYADADAARRAMAERREALSRCANHSEADGFRTLWRWEPLDIGEEALFVAGQRFRGDLAVPGHHRGVLMRQGRSVAMFVDFGQARNLADRSEVSGYERDAAIVASLLRTAAWN